MFTKSQILDTMIKVNHFGPPEFRKLLASSKVKAGLHSPHTISSQYPYHCLRKIHSQITFLESTLNNLDFIGSQDADFTVSLPLLEKNSFANHVP